MLLALVLHPGDERIQRLMTNEEHDEAHKKMFRADGTVDREALKFYSDKIRAEQNDRDFGLAIELWQMGWKSEPLRPGLAIMSWYWRRPPRGNRKRGRLFYSTDQAYSHMLRE